MTHSMSAFVIVTLSMGLSAGCSGGPSPNTSAEDGRLSPCPDSPNCVSTQSSDERHGIEALAFHGSSAETMARILAVVGEMDRTTVISRREDYLHVEYRTRIGFVDDVEFLLDEQTRTVRFRSASRVGYWDLGVNRRRIEKFSALYRDLP